MTHEDMTHEDIRDLLEAYVDETLDRTTRAEVDRHLKDCVECRAILDGVPAVQLGALDRPPFDDKAMRRAVRSTMLRLALNTLVLGFVALLVIALIGSLVIFPLVVNRGGRAAAATAATRDLAIMLNPGATADDVLYNSGILSRTSTVHLVRPVGTRLVELGPISTEIGPLTFVPTNGLVVSPQDGRVGSVNAAEQLADVGPGTVATVELHFDNPLDLDRAIALASTPLDIRVVWAGFPTATDQSSPDSLRPWTVGYSTCDVRDADLASFFGGTGGAMSGSPFAVTPSIDRALEQTIAALDNLLEHSELIDGIPFVGTRASVSEARQVLVDDPKVTVLVVTGPTSEVAQFLAEADPDWAEVQGIDFSNWYQPLCGK